jgi:hypothetical protein
MATGSDNEEERTETKAPASTPQLDRLEKLAKAATTSAQAKQWRARQNGLQEQDEPSEVRNLNHDAEARAQAEAAMQRMMAKPQGKRR